MTQPSPQRRFLIDVYAMNNEGQDRHLGGGYFTAPTQPEAETSAMNEFWREEWSDFGFQPAFQVDVLDNSVPAPSAKNHQSSQQALSALDTLIPFN